MIGRLLEGLFYALPVVVFLNQAMLSTLSTLTIWKGGGMGMFATGDGTSARYLVAVLEGPDGALSPAPSRALADRARAVIYWPTETRIAGLCPLILTEGVVWQDRLLLASESLARQNPPGARRVADLAPSSLRIDIRTYGLNERRFESRSLASQRFTVEDGHCQQI